MKSSQVVEKILAHSPNMLNAGKIRPKKKIKILTLYPGYDGMVKKTFHVTVPLNAPRFHVQSVLIHRSEDLFAMALRDL